LSVCDHRASDAAGGLRDRALFGAPVGEDDVEVAVVVDVAELEVADAEQARRAGSGSVALVKVPPPSLRNSWLCCTQVVPSTMSLSPS
jgi:hypothetical protein